jgi:hypothetical protein
MEKTTIRFARDIVRRPFGKSSAKFLRQQRNLARIGTLVNFYRDRIDFNAARRGLLRGAVDGGAARDWIAGSSHAVQDARNAAGRLLGTAKRTKGDAALLKKWRRWNSRPPLR